MTRPHLPYVLAQPVLELAQTDGPHGRNVAPGSYIVKPLLARLYPWFSFEEDEIPYVVEEAARRALAGSVPTVSERLEFRETGGQ